MNVILFEHGEVPGWLSAADPRAVHLREILKLLPGDRFLAGEVSGNLGTVRFAEIRDDGVVLDEPEFATAPHPLAPVRLLIGTPRPPTARRLLKDLTTLGASEIHFVATELGDKSYLQSRLWDGDWREALKEGASQDRNTLLPLVVRHQSLQKAFIVIGRPVAGVWFDGGGSPWKGALESVPTPLFLAIGPERGWSAAEKAKFGVEGWACASLGTSVLRTETACTLALGITRLKEL